MTRKYLSPAATTSAKIGLILIECLIGLFNLISFPIRKISFKGYLVVSAAIGVFYVYHFHASLVTHLPILVFVVFGFAAGLFGIKLIHKLLNKKVAPKVAFMINSPLGIPLNRYHVPAAYPAN